MSTRSQHAFPGPVSESGYQHLCGSCSESTEVQLLTGNVVSEVQVVDVSTVGLPLRFTLTHNSRDTLFGPVGHKWRHNCMMGLELMGSPVTYVEFVSPTGRHYGFVQSGSDWVLDTGNYFGYFDGVLTYASPTWRISFSDGRYYEFDDSGNLTSKVDGHGNETTFSYSGGLLSTVTEPTGRQIVLTYSDGLLDCITDPRGETTTLSYDSDANLTSVAGPAGCTTTFGYSVPSNHRITSITDARSNAYTFSYDGIGRLYRVYDPESNMVQYTYDSVEEIIGTAPTAPTTVTLSRTVLTDTNDRNWEYRFDLSGNLRRVIRPLLDSSWMFWDQIVPDGGISQQKLLYRDAGFPPSMPVSLNDRPSWRSIYDSTNNLGDLLYQVDASGAVTHYTYDSARNVMSVFPGQAHLGVQGSWIGQYGENGWLLCGFDDASSDVVSLPPYVSAVTPGDVTRLHIGEDSSTFNRLIDPRTLVAPDSLRRGVGYWQFAGTSPQISISLNTEASFNLSFYSCANNLGYQSDTPLNYNEQFGQDMTITVTDAEGTHDFRVYNNAGGVWVTFPVKGDATHPISVTVVPSGSNTDARISALTFDLYDNHRTTFTYNATNDVLTVTDGLGNQTSMTYNSDGTLASRTDANAHTTYFFYEDDAKNLTRLVDPAEAEWRRTYDENGNLLTVTDPNLRVTTQTYDEKNRLLSVTDALGHETSFEYDGTGNLVATTDANGHVTEMAYTSTNRLESVTDALGNAVAFEYDARGNRTSATDANGNTIRFEYDANGRLVKMVLADGSEVTYAYDGLDRLRAVTSANGNQSTLTDINLLHAYNWLLNPGAEQANPHHATQPLMWRPSASGSRDTTVHHSGTASFKLGVDLDPQYWEQRHVPMPSGVSALMQYWARSDGDGSPSSVWAQVTAYTQQGFGDTVDFSSGGTTLAGGSTDWVQSPMFAFKVPDNGNFRLFSLPQLRLNAFSGDSHDIWLDDVALYSVSAAMSYDREGRPRDTITPDGARVQRSYDRFGRTVAVTDPRGYAVTMHYDSLGRVVEVTDALGNTTSRTYDAVGNVVTVTDANGNVTTHAYDANDRLVTITYPDSTTEQFTYDAAGNLITYSNNRDQQKSFVRDAANRLVMIRYETDQSVVSHSYDAVGNLTVRVERNGDYLQFTYDAANRLVAVERVAAAGGSAWVHGYSYDANSNVTSFTAGADAPAFDAAQFDVDAFASSAASPVWAVPAYDARNLMPTFLDTEHRHTWFSHDVEGRLSQVERPGDTPAVTTLGYDIVGRLMTSDTATDSDLLLLGYGYDLAGNRVSLTTGDDTAYYEVDAVNRLLEEQLNTFTASSIFRFCLGTGSQIALDQARNTLSLLPFADSFKGDALRFDRWRMAYADIDFVGLEVRAKGDSLQFCFPRGFWNSSVNPTTSLSYGLNSSLVWSAAEHRQQLSGDFDVTVDFADFQGKDGFGALEAGLFVSPVSIEQAMQSGSTYASITRDNTPCYHAYAQVSGTSHIDTTSGATSDTAGRLRIARSGSTITLYYWSGTAGWASLGSYGSYSTADTFVALRFAAQSSAGSVGFRHFGHTAGTPRYATSGVFTSAPHDAGTSFTWSRVACDAILPGSSAIALQVAVSDDIAGPWSYVGPDGTSGTYFTSFPASLPTLSGRYCSVQATLTGDGTDTPVLQRVSLDHDGVLTSRVFSHAYDANGNLVRRCTKTADSTTLEVRDDPSWSGSDRINNLNQIRRNDVFTSPRYDEALLNTDVYAVPTTWRYTYDASGNLTEKTDGTNTTTYTWNEDNRLTLVSLPGGASVAYTYDVEGRLLTRTTSAGTTTFEWSGFDCVRELAEPSGTATYDTATFDGSATWGSNGVTTYHVVGGLLHGFIRDNALFTVVSDALGHVRRVLDAGGTVVASFEYDAWGNELAATDQVPGGFMYRYVGTYGARWDANTGLHYMRQRWYDAGLQRFNSRDMLGGENRYEAELNNPTAFIDPRGLDPFTATGFTDPVQSAIDYLARLGSTQKGVQPESAGGTGNRITYGSSTEGAENYNPEISTFLSNAAPPASVTGVLAHGYLPYGTDLFFNNGEGTRFSPKELADDIKTKGVGKVAILFVCGSGGKDRKGRIPAQELANALGVPVLAPNEEIRLQTNYLSAPDPRTFWQAFFPSGGTSPSTTLYNTGVRVYQGR